MNSVNEKMIQETINRLHNQKLKHVERKKRKEKELIDTLRYIRSLSGKLRHFPIKPIESSDGNYI